MKMKVAEKFTCEKCGRVMTKENTSTARYTIFVLWRCECGHQFLEKKHSPVAQEI